MEKKKLMNHDEPNDQYNQRNYPSEVYADLVSHFMNFAYGKVHESGLQKKGVRCVDVSISGCQFWNGIPLSAKMVHVVSDITPRSSLGRSRC